MLTLSLSLLCHVSMKEPVPCRRKKPGAVNGPSSRKLKLVCSFNGAFQRRPPSGKLRYIGGETRIISLDRTIAFANLRSKISDLRPTAPSFSLRYLRSGLCGGAADAPLVLIASDDDVRCMIQEFELYGKQSRLWLYVCSEDCVSLVKGVRDLNVNCDPFNDGVGGQIEGKLGVKSGNRVMCGDVSLRKVVLKQPSQNMHCVSCLKANEKEIKSACYGGNQKYDHPLIDLAPDPRVPVFLNPNSENLFESNILDRKMTSAGLPTSYQFGNLVQYGAPRLRPLNPRDANLRVEANRYPQCSPAGRVLCNGDERGQSVRIMQASQQSCNSRMNSQYYHGPFAKQNLRNIEGTMSIMNRENVPWTANGASGKTDQVPISCIGQLVQIAYPLNSNTGHELWGSSQSGIANHRCDGNDTRNQQVCFCHQNSMTEINNHQAVRLDGRCPSVRPKSNISKQGQSGRSYHHPLKIWTGFNNPIFEGRTGDVKPINENIRELGVLAVPLYGNPNPEACHLAYRTCAGVPEKPLFSHNGVEDASSCAKTMDSQVDLLTGFNSEVPDKSIHESFKGIPISCEPVDSDLERECLLKNPQKVTNNSGVSNNPVYGSATKPGCGTTALDAETSMISFGNFKNGTLESSVDISLCNLSLSSSKKVEPTLGPIADQSNGIVCPSSHIADKLDNDHLHDKDLSGLSRDGRADIKEGPNCLKVTDETGTSGNLSAFYTRLVTRELQIIKNSDLEHVKELGSGTYGTVFHGKWKGSDVAIKRIKPSCFIEGGVEEDRLVADFWREAYILGQLQHPNIVALYGVVTDGPAVNLATVTEYLVNGSLKQVLRRKDRTIDRRKRLIIAMDAAFGMEYLHEKNIVHFDLKSHNLLVNIRDPQRPVCKIGDMGLSKIKQKTLISGGVRGTIPWMAPELLNSENNLVTEKVDVYSFGIIMWELLTGEEPYGNMRLEEIIAGIIKGNLRPEIPNWCEPAWRSLMKRCWSSDPTTRPSFSEIAKELRAMSASMNIN